MNNVDEESRSKDLLVLKFGGASLSTSDSIKNAANIIIERSKSFKKIVVVASAMGDMTDKLVSLCKEISLTPDKREQDMLISVGERISIALLAMALKSRGVDAISFTGSQSGIITTDDHTDASIIDVKPFRIKEQLKNNKIVIIAGFQGVSQKKEITTLGRGGSDTSAVAIAIALGGCKVEFYKDVDGIYSADPKKNEKATLYRNISYEKLFKILDKGCKVLHRRCVNLASKNNIKLHLVPYIGFNNKTIEKGTLIGFEENHKNKKDVFIRNRICYEG
jgi:aspartate kinase